MLRGIPHSGWGRVILRGIPRSCWLLSLRVQSCLSALADSFLFRERLLLQLGCPCLTGQSPSAWISNLISSLDQHCSSPSFTWSVHTLWMPGINFTGRHQATDNPMSLPVLGVFYYSPGSYSHVSLGFEPFHVIARHDCTCSHTSVFDAVLVPYLREPRLRQ